MPKGVYDRKLFPPEVAKYIKEHMSGMKLSDLSDDLKKRFGKDYTYQQLKGYAYRNNLRFKFNIRHNLLLTDEQAEYMKTIIPGRRSSEVRDIMNEKYGLNLTQDQIRGWKKNHKTPSGYNTRYRVGNVPWLKGKKIIPKGKHLFKKGDAPHNKAPIGSLGYRVNGGRRYWFIKTRDDQVSNNYELLHKHIWEQANGKVPDGYMLVFRDGDSDNCTLENLKLIHRGANLVANTKIGLTDDPELNDVIWTTAELRRKASKLRKRKDK